MEYFTDQCQKCNIEQKVFISKYGTFCSKCADQVRKRHFYIKNTNLPLIQEKEHNSAYYINGKFDLKLYKKYYAQINKEKIAQFQKEYRENNKEQIKQDKREYYLLNKEHIINKSKEYSINNKEKVRQNHRKWEKNKMQDPIFHLKKVVSHSIRGALKGNKANQSTFKYLTYTVEELKIHLEALFESWMNWNNWGRYIVETWKDDDFSTWTWQIDHIIPHSCLPYTSMEDDNFKKCWSLSNLRPYSAKLNLIEGCNRTRHALQQ